MSKDSDDPDALYALAYAHLQTDDYADALPLLRRCVRLRPEFTDALAVLGRVYNELRKDAAAIRTLVKYFSTVGTPSHLAQLATAYRRTGNHERAATLYAASLSLDPTNARAFNNMAISLNALERHNEASSACLSGLKIKPGDENLLVNLIVAYGSSGRIAAALRLVTELSSHPPFSFGFLIEMGNVYADMKRHDEAILAYDEAKKLDPSNISSYVNLGILYEKMGRYEEGETQSFSTKACCSNQPSACVVSPTASQSVFVAATEIML